MKNNDKRIITKKFNMHCDVHCWDLSFLDAQTGSINSMKMSMKVGTKFSSNSQENSTLYTVVRGGYLYP